MGCKKSKESPWPSEEDAKEKSNVNFTVKPKPTVREALTKEAIFQELKAESNVKAGSSPHTDFHS